jgi:hypothetical protein
MTPRLPGDAVAERPSRMNTKAPGRRAGRHRKPPSRLIRHVAGGPAPMRRASTFRRVALCRGPKPPNFSRGRVAMAATMPGGVSPGAFCRRRPSPCGRGLQAIEVSFSAGSDKSQQSKLCLDYRYVTC